MRYFSYQLGGSYEPDIKTVSEEDIRKEHFPHWYDRMCKKFGQAKVDSEYSFEDCIEDFQGVYWAWEVQK